jgi:hypothetical protein
MVHTPTDLSFGRAALAAGGPPALPKLPLHNASESPGDRALPACWLLHLAEASANCTCACSSRPGATGVPPFSRSFSAHTRAENQSAQTRSGTAPGIQIQSIFPPRSEPRASLPNRQTPVSLILAAPLQTTCMLVQKKVMKRTMATLAALHVLMACGCDRQEPQKNMADQTVDNLFAEVNAKQDKLFAAFSQSEAVIIEGIVAPSGLGAGTGGEISHLTFATSPWRRQGGELVPQKAIVHKRCTKAEVDTIFKALSAYSVFQIEGKLIESPEGWDGPQIELLRIIKADLNAPELNQAVEELKKAVTHKDDQFGVFTLDRSVNWYNAQTTWMGATTRLSLDSGEGSAAFPQGSLDQARKLWKDAKRWDGEIRSRIVKELLELKNGTWLKEGEKQLTADDFLRRISLSSVTVYSDGSFEFWYDDGDLFLGHSIMVSGSIEGGLTDAGLQG